MNRRQFLVAAAVAGLSPWAAAGRGGLAEAGSLPVAAIQAVLDAAVSDDGLPGLVFGALTPRGNFLGAAGKADLAAPRAMEPGDQIRLASITKNMTAALILRLCEEGLLSTGDILAALLPDCGVPNAASITVAQLLNHTAGVYDHEESTDLDILSPGNFTKDWTAAEILAISNAHGPAFAPGAQWGYSNTGYYLLGLIAEKRTGQTFEAAIAQRFFRPLGLARTAVSRTGALAAPLTGGYCLVADGDFRVMTDWNMSWDWTAGSGVSTAADMLAWGRALFTGKLLSAASLAVMTTPTGKAADIIPGQVGYGCGTEVWTADEFFGQPCWSHGGGNGGTRTFLLHYPRAWRTLFIGANRFDYAPAGVDATALVKNVLTALVPYLDFPAPTAVPAVNGLLFDA
ncbi:MAG: serine hydrolase domain-containing protein [Solidesulfovibrio sp. DCME]|uniref:serine hydrolase domain-containing protein n=1 Tax=Solidesulfovibrio sp. DCME TaxID=3447380 RepID=UPI003D0C8571